MHFALPCFAEAYGSGTAMALGEVEAIIGHSMDECWGDTAKVAQEEGFKYPTEKSLRSCSKHFAPHYL